MRAEHDFCASLSTLNGAGACHGRPANGGHQVRRVEVEDSGGDLRGLLARGEPAPTIRREGGKSMLVAKQRAFTAFF